MPNSGETREGHSATRLWNFTLSTSLAVFKDFNDDDPIAGGKEGAVIISDGARVAFAFGRCHHHP